MSGAFAYALPAADGGDLPLARWSGQPLLIVNTASRCGFTPQYAGLQALWERRGGEGLVVIGAPSDDFRQQPEEAQAIGAFCTERYGVSFPLSGRIAVRGAAAHPLFCFLADAAGGLGRPRWNFYKYLVGRDGRLVGWFMPTTRPDSARIGRAIDRALAG